MPVAATPSAPAIPAAVQDLQTASQFYAKAASMDLSTSAGLQAALDVVDQGRVAANAGIPTLIQNQAGIAPDIFQHVQYGLTGADIGANIVDQEIQKKATLSSDMQQNVRQLVTDAGLAAKLGAQLLGAIKA